MTIYKEFRVGSNPNNPLGFLGPILLLAVFFTILFFFVKGLFFVLNIVAPVLLIITLILDYTVVKDFFVFLLKLLKENTFLGVLAVALTFFGYPFVSGFLFMKAILRRTVRKKFDAIKKREDTFTEYEEVKDDNEDFLELPPLHKQKQNKQENPYDDMFK